MAETKQDPIKVQLGSKEHPVRFSYLYAFKPKVKKDDNGNKVVDEDGNEVKMFSCQVRVPKADKAAKQLMDESVDKALDEFFGKKRPPASQLQLPIRDGDEEAESKGDETLRGHWFFNCSSKARPQVVGPKKNPDTGKFDRLTEDDIKSGDYGKISVNFFGFNKKSKGVAVGMGNIQLLKIGEALGSKTSAEEDFDEEDTDLDDGSSDSVL